jgi:hypothetical protein
LLIFEKFKEKSLTEILTINLDAIKNFYNNSINNKKNQEELDKHKATLDLSSKVLTITKKKVSKKVQIHNDPGASLEVEINNDPGASLEVEINNDPVASLDLLSSKVSSIEAMDSSTIVSTIKAKLNNLFHIVHEERMETKIYYKINFNFDDIEENNLKDLLSYLTQFGSILLLKSNNSTQEDKNFNSKISSILKLILQKFKIKYSIKMGFNKIEFNSTINIKNKLLEFIFHILLKPTELLKPINEISWLEEIIIKHNIKELLNLRNFLELCVKNSQLQKSTDAKQELEDLIKLIDQHGVDVLDLNMPLINSHVIDIIKLVHGNTNNYQYLHNVFIDANNEDNVDNISLFLNYISQQKHFSVDEQNLAIVDLMDFEKSGSFLLHFNHDFNNQQNDGYFSSKASICLNDNGNKIIMHSNDILNYLLTGSLSSIQLLLSQFKDQFELILNDDDNILSQEEFTYSNLKDIFYYEEIKNDLTGIEETFNYSKTLSDIIPILVSELDKNQNESLYNLINKFLNHLLNGCPHTLPIDDINHFEETFLFGDKVTLKSNKVPILLDFQKLRLKEDCSLKEFHFLCKSKPYNMLEPRKFYCYAYEHGIYLQVHKIYIIIKKLNVLKNNNINKYCTTEFISQSIDRLTDILNELQIWEKLCYELHKKNFSLLNKCEEIKEKNKNNTTNNEEVAKKQLKDISPTLVEKCEDLYNSKKNSSSAILLNKTNNNDFKSSIIIKKKTFTTTTDDEDVMCTSELPIVPAEELENEAEATEMEIMNIIVKNNNNILINNVDETIDYNNIEENCSSKKSIELLYVSIVHKTYLKDIKSRDELINFIYYYVTFNLSSEKFLTNKIDMLGWSEGLNVLGKRLNQLTDQVLDTYLYSFLPPKVATVCAKNKLSREDILETVIQYNKKINEAQFKYEILNSKQRNSYTVWFTLNRIYDTLCWYYINSLNEREKNSFPEIAKFKSILEKKYKISSDKNLPLFNDNFDRSLKEIHFKGKVSSKKRKRRDIDFFKNIFDNRCDDINNKMLLTTAIKIINLKFLDAKVYCHRLPDYAKDYMTSTKV